MASTDTRHRLWLSLAGVGMLLALVCLFGTGRQSHVALVLGSALGVAGVALGLRIHEPRSRRPWIAFAAGCTIFGISNSIRLVAYETGADLLVPIDIAESLGYGFVLFAALGLSKERNTDRDPSVVIDAMIVAAGVAAVVWIAVTLPYLQDGSVSVLKRVLDVVSSSLSIMLVFAMARYAMLAQYRLVPVAVLTAGAILAVMSEIAESSDLVWSIPVAHATAALALSTVGVAASHPKVDRVASTLTVGVARMTTKRLISLALAAVASPTFLVLQLVFGVGDVASYVGLSVTGLMASSLVLARVSGMMNSREADARLDSALRAGVKRLVSAEDEDEILRVATVALVELLGEIDPEAAVSLSPDVGAPGSTTVTRSAEGQDHVTRVPVVTGPLEARVLTIVTSVRISEQVVEVLESLVTDVTLALQRSRALAEQASNEERVRIERDLHDDVQQRLLSLRLRMSTSKGQATPELADVLDAYGNELGSTVRAIRDIVHRNDPFELRRDGLVASIRRDLNRLPGFEVEMHLPSEDPIGTDLQSVYFVFREAVSNVIKHSRANRIEVDLAASANGVILTVIDNGVGISTEDERAGLRSIKTRVRQLDGQTNVVGTPAGTRMTAAFPLQVDVRNR